MALPPLADLHLHANRAFTIGDALPKDFDDAITLVTAMAHDFTAIDYQRQASRLFGQIASKGTAHARTHADLGGVVGMQALEGTLAARAAFEGPLNIEIVAFASNADDPLDSSTAAMLRAAHGAGAEWLGAVPAYYAEPKKSIDAILDLALVLDCGVDLHLDEHLDPARSQSLYLAEATLARQMGARVCLSHGCAISSLPRDQQRRIADALAAAGVTVIALPATNLYLQDRGVHTPNRRGLTAVKEMIAAGVAVRFASDNIQDVFYPYGAGDMLDIAALAATAAHVEDPAMLVPAICGGQSGLQEGGPADFILIAGNSLGQILAERPAHRRQIVKGRSLAAR
ncbi:MAG: amidohydrolase family protein [Sphingomonadales bacterium]